MVIKYFYTIISTALIILLSLLSQTTTTTIIIIIIMILRITLLFSKITKIKQKLVDDETKLPLGIVSIMVMFFLIKYNN